MKILLTGATGYIGKRLLPILVAKGHTIICCVRDKNRLYIPLEIKNKIEVIEIDFLKKINAGLGLVATILEKSMDDINFFINQYKAEIPFFNFSNPIKHFYDQANKNVTKLIIRNKDRLTKEIKESGELMQLLAKSTRKDLSKEEKKKVKKQLLDICKTVPSLTIFLLPGGGLLLPILIKFIPQLLPSAFNENLDD